MISFFPPFFECGNTHGAGGRGFCRIKIDDSLFRDTDKDDGMFVVIAAYVDHERSLFFKELSYFANAGGVFNVDDLPLYHGGKS